MDEHFRSVLSTGYKPSSVDIVRFIGSPAFSGRKPGYYYTTGSKGTGYYYDPRQKDAFQTKAAEVTVGDQRKRKLDDIIDDDGEEGGTDHQYASHKRSDANDIDRLLEEAERSGALQLDSTSLKQMLINFEKKINKNQKTRMKYPDEPEKFMESEIELHEQIQELYTIAAYPDLYNIVVQFGSITSILGMITHENTDLSLAAVGLIQELTEADTVLEDPEAISLVDAFVEGQGLVLIVQNLQRLNEENEEDAQGVHNTLAIIENLVEINQKFAEIVCEQTQILDFLLKRIQSKSYDENKLYCSEVLSILVQSNSTIQRTICSMSETNDGLDALLTAISAYRKKDPETLDETEMLNNLFLCLCSVLLLPENQDKFAKAEGFELMLRCLKEGKHAGGSTALFPHLTSLSVPVPHPTFNTASDGLSGRSAKVINYALSKNRATCIKFVEVGGLKQLFPLLMSRNVPTLEKKKMGHQDRQEFDEAVVSAVAQLCLMLAGVGESDCGARVASKLLENAAEKVARCAELYVRYRKKLTVFDGELQRLRDQAIDEEDEETLEELEDEDLVMIKRLDGGLATLQDLASILSYACIISPSNVSCIQNKLSPEDLDLVDVFNVLEYNADIIAQQFNDTISRPDDEAGLAESSAPSTAADRLYMDTLLELKSALSILLEAASAA